MKFNFNTIAFGLLAVASTLMVTRCSHGPCNNVPQRNLEGEAGASPSPSPSLSDSNTTNVAEKPTALPTDAVQVYKATGEKQCEQNKGLSLDDLQAQLTGKKISIYESHTQPDGLMHMALCGAPTGSIHVFSINKKDLKKALRSGFKVLKTP